MPKVTIPACNTCNTCNLADVHPYLMTRASCLVGYYNNTCILAKANDTYLNLQGYGGMPTIGGINPCDADPKGAGALHTYLGGNRVYAPGAAVSVKYCGA
jgi:hypothetical protein